ncbi:MAG TPA: hypothetical protein VEC60_03040 [Reyranella sp.]|nr:hypothetical protein [Reyranella sp.]
MERSLVEFVQSPSPAPLWAEAGYDFAAFGAALDRVFGEAGDLHLHEQVAVADEPIMVIDDPLVLLANLMDGLGLPDPSPVTMPELAAVYDFAPDGFDLQDLWYDTHA